MPYPYIGTNHPRVRTPKQKADAALTGELRWNYRFNAAGTPGGKDFSGNGLDLTAVNSPTDRAGLLGQAFDGQSAGTTFYSRANSSDYHLTGECSLIVWVNPDVFVTNDFIFAFDPNHDWELLHRSTGFWEWWVDSAGFKIATATPAATTGAWQMLYCYYSDDLDEIGISVNNGTIVKVSSVTTQPATNGTTFRVCSYNGSIQGIDGAIDECAMWSKLLHTTDDLANVYNGGLGRQIVA